MHGKLSIIKNAKSPTDRRVVDNEKFMTGKVTLFVAFPKFVFL